MKQIRDAVEFLTEGTGFDFDDRNQMIELFKHSLVLKNLAEKVLAVGIGLSRTEISQIISQDNMVGFIETFDLKADQRQSIYDRIATAIHKAQMEKLGGVR